jgi:hypothetical protein
MKQSKVKWAKKKKEEERIKIEQQKEKLTKLNLLNEFFQKNKEDYKKKLEKKKTLKDDDGECYNPGNTFGALGEMPNIHNESHDMSSMLEDEYEEVQMQSIAGGTGA